MSTVGQIVRQRREALGLTLEALARSIGATKGYLSMIENHRVQNPPSAQLLSALERALHISDGELRRAADWQATPRPVRKQMQDMTDRHRKMEELAHWLKDSLSKRKEGGRDLDSSVRSGELARRVQQALEEQNTDPQAPGLDARVPVRFQVPLINQVAAGYPRGFTDLDYPARIADEYIPCPDVGDPQAFAARVVGDSMMPEYRQGDILIFSPGAKIESGNDCFVRLLPHHETTFKRVFFDGPAGKPSARIRLQPLNPNYPPTVVDRTQISGMYRVVWRYQKMT